MNTTPLHASGLTAEQITTVKFLVKEIIHADRAVAHAQAAADVIMKEMNRKTIMMPVEIQPAVSAIDAVIAAHETDLEFFMGKSAGMTSLVQRLVKFWQDVNELSQNPEVA